MAETDDLIDEARKAFARCQDAEDHNRATALDDLRFSRGGEQWPEAIRKQREQEERPCLTINKMPAFIRQVVNDARQNKPSIKVHPADDGADVETAEIINGLIRNIEYTSSADVAYDTAVECAVSGGFGYIRVGLDHTFDDSADLDITIDRVANPFSVYGDPNSRAADSSDWNVAFVVDRMTEEEFDAKFKGKSKIPWDDTSAWADVSADWRDDKTAMVAEWWTREEIDRPIVILDDGRVFDKASLEDDDDLALAVQLGLIKVARERTAKSKKVTQRFMSGVEVLSTRVWPGRFIPLVPVYGDEFDIEGKRFFRSLIHNAKDAQRMVNYWRTTSTELVALAPRVPWIGRKGAFDDDDNWSRANKTSLPFLEFTGPEAPQRQPIDTGSAAGALQEALNASDDMKAIIGLYDASLGARSNETSGKAIMARQREGDVSTFHFIDNMTRAIRHTGRIILDLIPKVYDKPRIVRTIGEDGTQEARPVNQPVPAMQDGQPQVDERGEAIVAMHDLTAGKYDLIVSAGPSFTSRREEAAAQMTEMIRAYPQAAPLIGDLLAKSFDWPGADEIAKRFEKALPAQVQGGLPPEVQQQIEQGKALIQQLQQKLQQMEADRSIEQDKIGIAKFEAETDRMKVQGDAAARLMAPAPQPAPHRFP